MLPCLRFAVARSVANQVLVTRSFAATSNASQQITDPIQKLFVDKVREYAQKSKGVELGLVDASADVKKHLQDTMEKVDRQFSATGVDMTKFPSMNFDNINLLDPGLGGTGEFTAPPKVDTEVEEDTVDYKQLPWLG